MDFRLRPAAQSALQHRRVRTNDPPATLHRQPGLRDSAVPDDLLPAARSGQKGCSCSPEHGEFLESDWTDRAGERYRNDRALPSANRPVRFLSPARLLPLRRFSQGDLSANGLRLPEMGRPRAWAARAGRETVRH